MIEARRCLAFAGATARVLAIAALLMAFWVALRWGPIAAAQDHAPGSQSSLRGTYADGPRSARSQRRLVELVAKVSFNEAADSYDDLALIWQVVEAHGVDDAGRARWLASHSRCVSGRLSQDEAYRRPGRCRWTRNLMPDGRRPRGWDRERDGHWSRTRPLWLAHIERVRAFVRGADDYRPCAIAPQTWDGETWRAQAIARGWVPVVCMGDARNIGYIRTGGAS